MACRESRKLAFCQNRDLWQLDDGKIEMVEDVAFPLIDANSVYARTPEQIQFCEDVLKYLDASNAISARLDLFQGKPSEHAFYLGKPFRITQKSYPGPFSLELIPSALKEYLRCSYYSAPF
jgi:hypothetical protein